MHLHFISLVQLTRAAIDGNILLISFVKYWDINIVWSSRLLIEVISIRNRENLTINIKAFCFCEYIQNKSRTLSFSCKSCTKQN